MSDIQGPPNAGGFPRRTGLAGALAAGVLVVLMVAVGVAAIGGDDAAEVGSAAGDVSAKLSIDDVLPAEEDVAKGLEREVRNNDSWSGTLPKPGADCAGLIREREPQDQRMVLFNDPDDRTRLLTVGIAEFEGPAEAEMAYRTVFAANKCADGDLRYESLGPSVAGAGLSDVYETTRLGETLSYHAIANAGRFTILASSNDSPEEAQELAEVVVSRL